MRGRTWVLAAVALSVAACESETRIVDPGGGTEPAAPRALDAYYYDRAVYVTWELPAAWDGDSFRVYSKRLSDPDYFLIAEVTNCTGGLCSYTDTNLQAGVAYEYYVASVGRSGFETPTDYAVEVSVPHPVAPQSPGAVEVVALDGAAYIRWNDASRDADDFSFYRVYLAGADGQDYLLGETDSEGFLDLLAENGLTYSYFVTAVDDQGHESGGSGLGEGTPRPDYHNEWIWDWMDRADLSGFRFQEDESVDPVVSGDDPSRHFRLESDVDGWWLVPGPDARVYPEAYETTALKCGPGADVGCTALEVAPTSGYTTQDIGLFPQTTYVLEVMGDDGSIHYGALRVTLLGLDQNGDGIMIFDWSYQLQPGNPALAPRGSVPVGRAGR